MAEIVVTGYPKSGNSWTCWLLGDILNCPVGGMYYAKPLCTEGQERPKQHRVYQLHLRPTWEYETKERYDKAVPSAWCLYVPKIADCPYRFVHVVRDPRDVVVSVRHYWNLPSLQEALRDVAFGEGPVKVHKGWSEHVERYLRLGVPIVRYEDLHEDGPNVLRALLDGWEVPYRSDRVEGAFERQSFARKRAQMEIDGDARVYNKGIHLHNLRKGRVGDWENHFTAEQTDLARGWFGAIAQQLGYLL